MGKDTENGNGLHLPAGTLLQGGKYRIVRFIGSGGFGCTYEAEHLMLEKRVAIKEFFVKEYCNRDVDSSRISVGTESRRALVSKLHRKFIDEAKSLCRLHHPGIVRVSDVFEENGTAYYVMDYIDGRSLQDIVKAEGQLPEECALKYIRQVSEALSYVHYNNRLHLDIKPGNIMVDGNDNAILIDFGASKQYDEASGENTSTLMGRTPGYAPLEQMSNTVTRFLPATDIYALGATMYKLLTGETPVDSTLLASGGEELSPLPAGISSGTRRAVSAAMELNKGKRPQSMDEFLSILDGGREGEESEETDITSTDSDKTELDAASVHKPVSSPKPEEPSSDSAKPGESGPKGRGKSKRLKFFKWSILAIGVILLIWIAVYIVNTNMGLAYRGTENGYKWVDLGLSVKWATCNVGATSPSDYGNYYAWGETTPKSSYTVDNSRTYEVKMGDIGGDRDYDAARANWGGSWRLPTEAEMEELVNKCSWEWTSQDGHKGFRVTGPNGTSIFLPAAGWRNGPSLGDAGDYGYYCTSAPNGGNTQGAYSLNFYGGSRYVIWSSRHLGYSVRPVKE